LHDAHQAARRSDDRFEDRKEAKAMTNTILLALVLALLGWLRQRARWTPEHRRLLRIKRRTRTSYRKTK
jgi:hypothetical protein